MDIQRKAFEAYMADRYKNTVDQRVCINSDGDYMAWDMQVAWHVWQAAKARAVPYEPGSFKSSHEIIINETKSELIDGYDIAKEDEYLLESLVYRGVCIGKAQAVPEVITIGNELQSWVVVWSFSAKNDGEDYVVVDANLLAEKIEKLTGAKG